MGVPRRTSDDQLAPLGLSFASHRSLKQVNGGLPARGLPWTIPHKRKVSKGRAQLRYSSATPPLTASKRFRYARRSNGGARNAGSPRATSRRARIIRKRSSDRSAPRGLWCWSSPNAANNSDEIKKELSLASRYHVPVMALRIEDVEPSDAFAYELSTRQWIDAFSGWDRSIDSLVHRLGELSGSPPPGSMPSSPAPARAKPIGKRPLLIACAAFVLLTAIGAAWWFLRPAPSAAHSMMVRLDRLPAPLDRFAGNLARHRPRRAHRRLWRSRRRRSFDCFDTSSGACARLRTRWNDPPRRQPGPGHHAARERAFGRDIMVE